MFDLELGGRVAGIARQVDDVLPVGVIDPKPSRFGLLGSTGGYVYLTREQRLKAIKTTK